MVFMSSVPLCFRVRRVVLIASAALAFPAMVGAATIKVCASGCPYSNLQSAINAAQPGDTLLLRAGETFVGNFMLPAKTASSTAFITIRSDAADSALPGPATRLVPSGRSGANTSRTLLPRLLGAGGTATSVPVIRTLPGAHHFRLQFLEVDGTAQLGYETLIAVGTDKADTPPHDIVFDRVYVHGHATKGQKRGIALNGGSTDVLNSYIADIKSANYDSQAIAGWNGAGPYRIVNNYIEAAGENVMFGGFRPRQDRSDSERHRDHGQRHREADRVAQPDSGGARIAQSRGVLGDRIAERRQALLQDRGGDAVVGRGSRFTAVCRGLGDRDVRPRDRPVLECQCRSGQVSDLPRYNCGWRGQVHHDVGIDRVVRLHGRGRERRQTTRRRRHDWIAKNLLEFKNAQRVTIDGNRFENNWSGDQPGYAIVLTPRNVAGRTPWSAVRDVTFTNNIVRHTAGAVNILGYDDTQPAGSQITQRITIRNNLFYDIDSRELGRRPTEVLPDRAGRHRRDVRPQHDRPRTRHRPRCLRQTDGALRLHEQHRAATAQYGVMGTSARRPAIRPWRSTSPARFSNTTCWPEERPRFIPRPTCFQRSPSGTRHSSTRQRVTTTCARRPCSFTPAAEAARPVSMSMFSMSSDDITVDPLRRLHRHRRRVNPQPPMPADRTRPRRSRISPSPVRRPRMAAARSPPTRGNGETRSSSTRRTRRRRTFTASGRRRRWPGPRPALRS